MDHSVYIPSTYAYAMVVVPKKERGSDIAILTGKLHQICSIKFSRDVMRCLPCFFLVTRVFCVFSGLYTLRGGESGVRDLKTYMQNVKSGHGHSNRGSWASEVRSLEAASGNTQLTEALAGPSTSVGIKRQETKAKKAEAQRKKVQQMLRGRGIEGGDEDDSE